MVNSNRFALFFSTFTSALYQRGGLQKGGNTSNCLIREFREELDLAAETGDHTYTIDFYQSSYAKAAQQLLFIY
jgi:8-oxo-dGTP diphosphatase